MYSYVVECDVDSIFSMLLFLKKASIKRVFLLLFCFLWNLYDIICFSSTVWTFFCMLQPQIKAHPAKSNLAAFAAIQVLDCIQAYEALFCWLLLNRRHISGVKFLHDLNCRKARVVNSSGVIIVCRRSPLFGGHSHQH